MFDGVKTADLELEESFSQFLEEFRKIAPSFNWYLYRNCASGKSRPVTRQLANEMQIYDIPLHDKEEAENAILNGFNLRGRKRILGVFESRHSFCPMTAVAERNLHGKFPAGLWDLAAYRLGIPRRTARAIVNAADSFYASDRICTSFGKRLLKAAAGI